MADLQDEIRKLEEERLKRITEERKLAAEISDLTKETKENQIKAEKNLQNANEEHAKQQQKIADLRKKLDGEEAEKNEKMKEGLNQAIKTQEDLLNKLDEEQKSRKKTLDVSTEALNINTDLAKKAIANQKEHALAEKQKTDEANKKKLEAQKSDAKKQKEIADKEKLLFKLKETQINGLQNTLLGINKSITEFGDTIKGRFAQTTIGKGLSLAGKGLSLFKKVKDPEIEKQEKELAKLKGEKPEEEKEKEKAKVSALLKPFGIGGIIEKQEKKDELLNPKKEESEDKSDTPQNVNIVSQPKPEKDSFAEEKAKEASHVQAEQTETQERIADSLEKSQTLKVEGKEGGIFGIIIGGIFNPLKTLGDMVSGIFDIIDAFIKGIGQILKSALGVVKDLVKGIGDILLTLVDIIGKGFVKIMTFAGRGIAALFKALGSIPPQALLIGAAAIGVLTLAFMGLGKGLQMMTPAIKELATIPFDNFLSLAGGLLVLSPALIAFGVGAAIATPGFLGLALGVGALGLAMKLLAPAIETIVPPITDLLGGFGDFLSTLQGIVSKFFTSIGDFIATVGTAISDFISNFAQSLVIMNDADFVHIAAGFVALGVALAGFGVAAAIAIPSLLALGSASSGLADLINVPPDRFDALRESFKLLGKAVKGFAKDAKGLGSTVVAMGALSMMPFARKLLDVQLAKTETRNVVDNFKGGVAEAIQPVDIVSFSGARTERGIEMLRQAAETNEIRDETIMQATSSPQIVSTPITTANSVTNNALIVQDSPTDSGFRASVGTYGP